MAELGDLLQPWSVLLPEVTLMSVVQVASQGHVDICVLCCHLSPRCKMRFMLLLKPCWYLWFMWWPEAMCVSVVCVPTGNHDIFAVLFATEGHADVYILCCWWGPGWFLWSLLRLEAMWMFVVVCAASGDHVEVHGSCNLWRLCWYPCLVQPGWCSCSMMYPRAVLIFMNCAATINHVESL